MNIAVIFNKDIKDGGGFQHALSISLLLEKCKADKRNFVYFTTIKKNLNILKEYNISAIYLPWSNLDRFILSISGSQLISDICSKIKIKLEFKLDRIFKKHNIDLVYFLSPADIALAINRYNYVFTVWDICFRNDMEFPELYENREFERRERLYKIALSKAIRVITDSEFTKQGIVKKYGIDEKRITVFSLLPSPSVNISEQEYEHNYIDMKKKYNINGDYIFYPAQFWPHKNHIYILQGLRILKEKYNKVINAVFVGSEKSNLSFVMKKADELGVKNQIRYLGFAENKEMPYLYKQALALVMPTYLGPTNMPPFEAFKMGLPVLYSNLPELRDQVKDAVIWLDLKNPETMCEGLLKVIGNTPEVQTLVENGKRKIESLMKEDRCEVLKNIFDDYKIKLKTWKALLPDA